MAADNATDGAGVLLSADAVISNISRVDHYLRISCGWPFADGVYRALRQLGQIVCRLRPPATNGRLGHAADRTAWLALPAQQQFKIHIQRNDVQRFAVQYEIELGQHARTQKISYAKRPQRLRRRSGWNWSPFTVRRLIGVVVHGRARPRILGTPHCTYRPWRSLRPLPSVCPPGNRRPTSWYLR